MFNKCIAPQPIFACSCTQTKWKLNKRLPARYNIRFIIKWIKTRVFHFKISIANNKKQQKILFDWQITTNNIRCKEDEKLWKKSRSNICTVFHGVCFTFGSNYSKMTIRPKSDIEWPFSRADFFSTKLYIAGRSFVFVYCAHFTAHWTNPTNFNNIHTVRALVYHSSFGGGAWATSTVRLSSDWLTTNTHNICLFALRLMFRFEWKSSRNHWNGAKIRWVFHEIRRPDEEKWYTHTHTLVRW